MMLATGAKEDGRPFLSAEPGGVAREGAGPGGTGDVSGEASVGLPMGLPSGLPLGSDIAPAH